MPSVASSCRLSRWCRPIDGSSSTYSTPVSCDPICVASRMRWPSPPESVAALAPEREIADADVDEKPQPIANLAHARGRRSDARARSARASRRAAAPRTIGKLHVLGEPAALHAHGAALGPQPLAVARRARPAARGTARALPDPSTCLRRTGAAGSESRPRSPRRTDRPAPSRAPSASARSPACGLTGRSPSGAPNSTMSRSFFGSLPNGSFGSMPNVRCEPAEHLVDEAAIALRPRQRSRRPSSDRRSSGTMRAGSKS